MLIFAAGTLVWYRPGPYQMIVHARRTVTCTWCASNQWKTCCICDMHLNKFCLILLSITVSHAIHGEQIGNSARQFNLLDKKKKKNVVQCLTFQGKYLKWFLISLSGFIVIRINESKYLNKCDNIVIDLKKWMSILRVDKSLCQPKLKSITVLLYDFAGVFDLVSKRFNFCHEQC